ncbi:MAG: hypothetical protein JWP09_8 [Candidatus Taylorbacteria bacterium]|nr:hypothetical protein [Candidatus Taylorbacteria bacterium]
MSLDIILVLISVCLSLFGSYNYVRDTIKGTTRPNRVSQGLWALTSLIGVGAALASGAEVLTTVRIFMAGFVPLIIFITSFANKIGYWKTTKFDYVCGLFSLLAIVLWLIADLPIYAILFAVTADLFASIPTIRKSWTNPESETGINYIMGILSLIVIIPTIKVFDIQNTAFQIYLFLVDSVIIFCIYRKRVFRSESI